MAPRRPSYRLHDTIDWLIARGKKYNNKEIGHIAKGRLIGALENGRTDDRNLVQYVRIGLEVASEVGAGKDLTIRHQHMIEVPPAAQEMIARRIMELQQSSATEQQKEAIDADTGRALPLENSEIR